ncbi:unnamed protein product [Lactuca saligna]|uniref:DUF4283 domain-containing protein n=1 Tax=Lactuca saligna TaxID=75948 RepID=A0AA35XZP0_LACSI|nr:unnamed protein product [Lactuca saligna]
MEGVPPDIEPDVIMSKKKKRKGAKSRNKQKTDIETPSGGGKEAIPIAIKSSDSPIVKEGEVLGSKASSINLSDDVAASSVVTPSISTSIKMEKRSFGDLVSLVHEFEKDITQFCSLGEKNSMLVFWNSLSASEKEGFVHGLRFTKRKYNNGNDSENSFEESIDNVKKLSSVSHRNDLLLRWKDLSNKKEMVFHKLCTSKVKKQVEANFGKNRIPFNSSSSLFPVSIEMKRSSELEASVGLKKVGDTIARVLPEGVPISEDNEPVIVNLEKKNNSMQHLAKVKKEKGNFEIDEMVSKQLEEVCNNIVYHFPSKFSHLDIVNNGEFKFNYVDEEIGGNDGKMVVDENVIMKENAKNLNGGLPISDVMLENAKPGIAQEKKDMQQPNSIGVDSIIGEKVSYAEKVSGKILNAANLISVIKKDPKLPDGVVEMSYGDILKGFSPFKTTLYGYFIDKHINFFFNFNKYAHNMWRKYGLEEVMVNDEGIYFFRFSSEHGMISVLEGGVWMIFESALVVRRWTTGNGTGLSHIAWEIGKPLDVDAHTAKMCQDHWGRPAFMRILIEMSASKDWLKEVQVYSSDLTTGERIISKCRVEYAWNPSKCSHYKVYGHKEPKCGILLAKQVREIDNNSKMGKNK